MPSHRIEPDSLAETDRRWLMAQLEGELDGDDWRYYLDAATLDVLAATGASAALLKRLADWLGSDDGIELLIRSDEARQAHAADAARHPQRYRLKSKRGFKDRFWVEDGSGRPVYEFTEHTFVLAGEKLTMTDAHGQEQLQISKKLMAMGHTYCLLRAEKEIARVHRHGWLLDPVAFKLVLAEGGDTIDISHGRSFVRHGRSVVEMDLRDGGWHVDIAQGQDDTLLLAAMVATELIERCEQRDD